MGQLKAAELQGLPPKKYHDGEGLYFDKKKRGASWLYKYTLNGAAREMGLGKFPEIPLSKARELAAKARGLKAEGKDPIAERDAVRRQGITFDDAAREYWQVHCQHYAKPSNWIRGMEINVFPHVGRKAVADLTPDDLIKFLKPIWGQEKTRKLRQWINAVIGYVSVDDPRVDRDLMARVANRLGAQNIKHENHPSVPWQDAPALWCALHDTAVGLSMKLLMLSAVRVNCVSSAEWSEFDFKEKVWTIPAGRVKHWKFVYRVPLTGDMIDILRTARRKWGDNGYVFQSELSKSGYLSNNAHRLWLHKYDWKDADGRLATAHGLRTTFRNWSDDVYKIDWHLGEHIIQHMKGRGDRDQRAYLRTDQIDRRREVLEEWGAYLRSLAEARYRRDKARAALDDVAELSTGRTKREVLEWARADMVDDS
ncbi:tyrosine-type recombinase/integrase [Arenibacterium sp. CAU 1754]